jgi:RHS repeat-associated protein
MAGISSKAAGNTQNKEKTFQGQRLDEDFALNWVQFKWRSHDPQIGRFIQIDPLCIKYVHNSTYAFSENKVVAHVELEGLEAVIIINRPQAAQKITNAIKTGNVDEAKRLVWVAVSRKEATFTPDQNKVKSPGYNVFDKAGNGLLGENDRNRILNGPKEPWIKGGVDKTVLNDLKNDLAELTKKTEELKAQIKNKKDMKESVFETESSDYSDPDVGSTMGKYVWTYTFGVEIEKLEKKLEPLEIQRAYVEQEYLKLNKQESEAQKKASGGVVLNISVTKE